MSKFDLKKLTSDTRTLARLVIAVGVLLVLSVAGFGAYYYYDRYYRPQPAIMPQGIKEAEEAVMADPHNMDNHLNLAEVYAINGKHDDALLTINNVLLVEPENHRGWLLLGIVTNLKGDVQAAVEPLEKYYDAYKDADMPGLNRPLMMAGYYLGDSYLKLGQPEKAVEVLENIVRWSRTDADSMVLLGEAYIQVKNFNDAEAMFIYATTYVPNFQEGYEGLVKVYEQTGNTALADYANGMVAYTKKDYASAQSFLLLAAGANKTFPPIFTGLGMTYEAQGDLENAKNAYDTALMLDPNSMVASYGQQRVSTLLDK